jgi:hypothetical protein
MPDEPRRRRQTPDLETNTSPDALRDDLRLVDQGQTPPDSVPPRDHERGGERPTGGGFTLASDYGNAQDVTSSDYEREIDRLDAAIRMR